MTAKTWWCSCSTTYPQGSGVTYSRATSRCCRPLTRSSLMKWETLSTPFCARPSRISSWLESLSSSPILSMPKTLKNAKLNLESCPRSLRKVTQSSQPLLSFLTSLSMTCCYSHRSVKVSSEKNVATSIFGKQWERSCWFNKRRLTPKISILLANLKALKENHRSLLYLRIWCDFSRCSLTSKATPSSLLRMEER